MRDHAVMQTGTYDRNAATYVLGLGNPSFHAAKVVIADMDLDGFGDLIVSCHGYQPPVITENESAFVVLRNKFKAMNP